MSLLFDHNLVNDAVFEKILHYITGVVGTHAEVGILKKCLSLDGGSLHGLVHNFYDSRAMAVAYRTKEIPWNVRKMAGERFQTKITS